MRLNLPSVAAASTVAAVILAVSGPLPATAADSTGATTPQASATPAATDAPEPTDVTGPDLIELTTPDKTTPIPLPVEDYWLPLANTPLFDLKQPTPPRPVPVTRFGGGAVGMYVEGKLGDLGLKIGKIGGVYMPDRSSSKHEVSKIEVPIWPVYGLATTSGIKSESQSYQSTMRAESTSKIAKVELAPGNALAALTVLFPLPPSLNQVISAEALESSAVVSQSPDGEFITTAESKLGKLTINGKVAPLKDYAPNTTYNVAGLGKVVINEQHITRIPGEKYAAKVHALHITLSTATAGLPVGAHIYIGTAEAVIYL